MKSMTLSEITLQTCKIFLLPAPCVATMPPVTPKTLQTTEGPSKDGARKYPSGHSEKKGKGFIINKCISSFIKYKDSARAVIGQM